MALRVLQPGLFTTVQDLGRSGHRGFGVPVGGAFDLRSAGLANALVGNDPEAAVLELTLWGGSFEAEADLALGLAGAPMAAFAGLNGPTTRRRLAVPGSFTLRAGERLTFATTLTGARTYLAVAGGWLTPTVLGSRCSETPIAAGDLLPARPGTAIPCRRPAVPFPIETDPDEPLRVVDGPDAIALDLDPSLWCGPVFRVGSRSDRMGLRLEGPAIAVPADPNRMSAPVAPGALQVAGGQLIVLGVACGTMGGYPHVAHVISADLPLLGQLRPGQNVRFRRVAMDEARALDRLSRRELACRLQLIRTLARDGLTSQDQAVPASSAQSPARNAPAPRILPLLSA